MWEKRKCLMRVYALHSVLHFFVFLRVSTCASSDLPVVSNTPTTMDDGVQRIGVGEVLIVDEFGREARSYWDPAAAEEKVEAVTVYGGMEVVSGRASNDGGPDVVKGHPMKEELGEPREDESSDTNLPIDNSVKDTGLDATLLECVLQGDITCIQKKAFRALQKLIQMSNSGAAPGSHSTSTEEDRVSSKENEDGMEKIDKGVLQDAHAWWSISGGVAPVKNEGATGGTGVMGNVLNAVSANGGMSRLLEEVRELFVDLVSNVISLQEDEEDRKRGIEQRSDDGKRKRKRRSVVGKKGAGPLPAEVAAKLPSAIQNGEKQGTTETDRVSGKRAEDTAVQRGKKKNKRTGMSSILMGILTIKSIFSYLGMVFSQVLQLKQLGISLLSFFVSIVRLILLFRQSNTEKQPQTDTKVVYLKPQYNHGHYGDHVQSQYGSEYYKRSFDGSSNSKPTQESAHDIAYAAQKPTEIK